jgi:hypothetical protein
MRLLKYLKNHIVGPEIRRRTILCGPFRSIALNLSLQTQMQMYLGLFEKEIHFYLQALTRNIATGIDVGAAYGEYTLFLLAKTRAENVYSFEPDVGLQAPLQKNLRINQFNDSVRLKLFSQFVGTTAAGNVVPLDSLLAQMRLPCFIKVDVDGGEEKVLRGAESLNQQYGVRWLIETHSRDLEAACESILKRAKFTTVVIPNAWWRTVIPELRPKAHNRWLAAWNDGAIH